MTEHPLLSLVFPAYNERDRILETLRETIEFFEKTGITFELRLVADGNDGTREMVETAYKGDPRIHVSGSAKRRGKGLGIKEGVLAARGRWIGFADADNKTPITEFLKIRPFLESRTPVVIGTRRLKGHQTKAKRRWYRSLGSATFNAALQTAMGLRGIPDTQCGFKFFQSEVAKKLFSLQQTNGYMFDVEILLLARKLGLEIKQVPVEWRDDLDSRFKPVSGMLRNLRELLKIRLAVT